VLRPWSSGFKLRRQPKKSRQDISISAPGFEKAGWNAILPIDPSGYLCRIETQISDV
jgi:hypothetical protein